MEHQFAYSADDHCTQVPRLDFSDLDSPTESEFSENCYTSGSSIGGLSMGILSESDCGTIHGYHNARSLACGLLPMDHFDATAFMREPGASSSSHQFCLSEHEQYRDLSDFQSFGNLATRCPTFEDLYLQHQKSFAMVYQPEPPSSTSSRSNREPQQTDKNKVPSPLSPSVDVPDSHREHPWACAACPRSFSQRSDLKKHKKTHLNKSERPHPCRTCGSRFIYMKDLNRHTRSKHEKPSLSALTLRTSDWTRSADRSYCSDDECEYAWKGFARKDHYSQHKRRVHGSS